MFYKTNGTVNRTSEEIQGAKKLYPEEMSMREFIRANIDKILPQ